MTILRSAYEAGALLIYSGTYIVGAISRQLSYRMREWCRGNREYTN